MYTGVQKDLSIEVCVNILIADDSSLIRSNLGKLIACLEKDISIRESSDVKETIEVLESTFVDILVLDIQFPDGNGFDVLSHIRSSVKSKDRPYIIVLTNYADENMRKKSMQMGADDFFDKSEEFENLVEVIKKAEDLPGKA